jgi:hypothetical protein
VRSLPRCDVGPGPSAWHRRKRGTQNQAIGKSRGGLTTKIAVIVDALDNLIRFVLLSGQRHDITSFDAQTGPVGQVRLGGEAHGVGVIGIIYPLPHLRLCENEI